MARRQEAHTNDGKLAIFLGVLLPAAICFTTVGRLWYLPGSLLVGSAALLAYEFWIAAPPNVTVGCGDSWMKMEEKMLKEAYGAYGGVDCNVCR